ncbi:hypothetical protein GPECTOR_106g115 [Gonium pectorale]|uniref:PA domain-containing protein n=1 Tax=Gonium pectorale TaxID=33097 RepID=A0A150FZI4_GONPE|nr:hypothetical protein GPECTOR_106g115 [Gonium pectorale]|eukprot:KXZ43021.1 hypothetical protein GPECTOR_106g115 [Gonium pectorale]
MSWALRSALLVVLLLGVFSLVHARDTCYGPIVEVSLSPTEREPDQLASMVLYGVLADVGANLSQPLFGAPIAVAEPVDACGSIAASAPGSALLVRRGNCSFADKARACQAAGAAAMLLYDDQPGCITMGFEPNASDWLTLAAVSLPHEAGLRVAAALAGAAAAASPTHGSAPYAVALRLAEVSRVDAGAGLLWALAVGCVVLGGLWSGADHAASRRAEQEDATPLLRSAHGGGGGQESVDLTPAAAGVFVLVASAMLLALFFLLNRVFFFVLLGMFCLASVQSQTVLYAAGLQALLPRTKRAATVQLPWLGPCPLAPVAAAPVAAAVAVVWAVWRNEDWAWVLQDLQVACILLPGCLLYDVFWVFIQPLLFGGGQSVMVQVAQGGSSGEFIPMLLRVPHFGLPGLGGYSLLGFGDVILPGLLVAYMRRVDLDLAWPGSAAAAAAAAAEPGSAGSAKAAAAAAAGWLPRLLPRSYFPYAVLAYGAGLCLTYAALAFSWFGDQGQPALLYLVPCTLLTVLAAAAARGHVGMLWRGATRGSAAPTRGSALSRLLAPEDDHDSDDNDSGRQGGHCGGGVSGLGSGSGGGGGVVVEDVEAGRGSAGRASVRRSVGEGSRSSRSPSPL